MWVIRVYVLGYLLDLALLAQNGFTRVSMDGGRNTHRKCGFSLHYVAQRRRTDAAVHGYADAKLHTSVVNAALEPA